MKKHIKRLTLLLTALFVLLSNISVYCAEPDIIIEKTGPDTEIYMDDSLIEKDASNGLANDVKDTFVIPKEEPPVDPAESNSTESSFETEDETKSDVTSIKPIEGNENNLLEGNEEASLKTVLNDTEITQNIAVDEYIIDAIIPANTLPIGASLCADIVDYKTDVEKVEDAITENETITFIKVFDIYFMTNNGEIIQPDDTVIISIALKEEEINNCDEIKVYCTDEVVAEEVTAVKTEDGVEFEAPHFSNYAIVGTTYALDPVDDSVYDLETSTSIGNYICRVENESFVNVNISSITFLSDPSFDPDASIDGVYYGPVDVTANAKKTGMIWAYTKQNGSLYDLYFVTLGDKINLTNCRKTKSPFYNLTNATSVSGMELLNTSKVTNMQGMFKGCALINTLDLSSFDTTSVTDMSYMFDGCASLQSITLTSFITSNVTNMYAMFRNCGVLETCDVSGFDTSLVTDMKDMFNSCEALEICDVSGFNTANVTDMSGMFYDCTKLSQIDVSGFQTLKLTNIKNMFASCQSVESLNLSAFNTSLVTDMTGLFYDCMNLKQVNLSNINTQNTTSIAKMFYNCPHLTSIDLSSFNTSKVTDMDHMFYNCRSLLEIDLSNFETPALTATNEMFKYCYDLQRLNISNFDLSALTDYTDMFCRTDDLIKLNTPKTNPYDIPLAKTMYTSPGNTETSSLPVTTGESVLLIAELTVSHLLYGTDFANAIDTICAPKETENAPINGGRTNSNVKSITFARNNPDEGINIDKVNGVKVDTEGHTYATNDGNGNILIVTEANILKPNNDATGLFKNLSGLTSINGMDLLNMSEVWTTSCMFEGCRSLESIDLSAFSVAPIVNTYGMFDYCESLKTIDLSSLNLSNSEQYALLFRSCSSLESIDLSHVNTIKSSSMEAMFADCTSLKTVTFANGVDTSAVTWMKSVFSGCTSLTSIENLASFNTSNVTSMATMFYNCRALTSLDLSTFDTSKVTDMNQMFAQCISLQTVDVSNFNTDSVTNMYSMFYNCQSVTDIDLSNAHKLAYTSGMFYNCAALQSVTFADNIDTSSVTNMGDMFSRCSSLKRIDLSNFDTSNVTNIWDLFANCSSLEYIDISSFDLSNVTVLGNPFVNTNDLKTLKTPKVNPLDTIVLAKEMLNTNTFTNTTKLPVTTGYSVMLIREGDYYLDTGNDKTTLFGVIPRDKILSVTFTYDRDFNETEIYPGSDALPVNVGNDPETGYYMYKIPDGDMYNVYVVSKNFAKFIVNGELYSVFYKNTNMTTISGLGLLDTSRTYSLGRMFLGCSALTNFDIENLSTEGITAFDYMFSSCTSLTSLDLSNFDTSSGINFDSMFNKCTSLTSLNVSSFNTSNALHMQHMFEDNNNLTLLNISNFDTTKVDNVSYMFNNCNNLQTLILGENFNTCNSTTFYNMFANNNKLSVVDTSKINTQSATGLSNMFENCSSLESIDLSNFYTANVTSFENLFSGCSSLERIDLSKFSTENIASYTKMFYGCTSLKSVDLSNFVIPSRVYGTSNVFAESAIREIILPKSVDKSTFPLPKTFKLCNADGVITGPDTENLISKSNSYTKAMDIQETSVTFIVPKKIELKAKDNASYTGYEDYSIKVYANNTVDLVDSAAAKIIPPSGVYMKQEGKEDILLNITQTNTVFNLKEVEALPESTLCENGHITTNNLTAGNWEGNFDFSIDLENIRYEIN